MRQGDKPSVGPNRSGPAYKSNNRGRKTPKHGTAGRNPSTGGPPKRGKRRATLPNRYPQGAPANTSVKAGPKRKKYKNSAQAMSPKWHKKFGKTFS
jgi:hypothetical protein